MSPVNPPEPPVPDELTARLVDEASRLLAEGGPAGLSLRKLAGATGVSTMAVYTRFGDKPRLLDAMYREGFRRLAAALLAAPATGDPLADLGAQGLAYRTAALDSPQLYPLMFGPPPAGFVPDEEAEVAAHAAYAPLLAGVRRCVTAGVLTGDVERIALHLWSVTHGMVTLELAGALPPGTDAALAYQQALGLAAIPFLPAG